jgi:hypothetical protein
MRLFDCLRTPKRPALNIPLLTQNSDATEALTEYQLVSPEPQENMTKIATSCWNIRAQKNMTQVKKVLLSPPTEAMTDPSFRLNN